jgi:hypothetical protein
MTCSTGKPQHMRRRGGFGPRDGQGRGRGPGLGAGRKDDASLTVRTATRAMIAAGTYVAQDVRDRDGLTRPMLRRAALRMVGCRQEPLRRLGAAYLRADPPAREELPGRAAAALPPQTVTPAAAATGGGQVIDIDPATVVEVDGAGAPVV